MSPRHPLTWQALSRAAEPVRSPYPVTTARPNQPLTSHLDPGVVYPALAGHAVVPLAGGGLLLALGAVALEGRVVGAVLAPMVIAATGEAKGDRHDHNPPQRHSPPSGCSTRPNRTARRRPGARASVLHRRPIGDRKSLPAKASAGG